MLTPKKKLFVENYLVSLNATEAAKLAGYSQRTANTQGPRLLVDVQVKKYLQEKMAERSERTGIKAEDVIEELKKLVFFDPRKFFDEGGRPIPIEKLDEDSAKCIAGIEVMEQYEGSGKDRKFIGYIKKYKLIDKNSAIDKALKHLGLYKNNEVSNVTNIQNNVQAGTVLILPAKQIHPNEIKLREDRDQSAAGTTGRLPKL